MQEACADAGNARGCRDAAPHRRRNAPAALSRGAGDQVAAGPLAQLIEDRQQALPAVGERVRHRDRRAGSDRSHDESGVGQFREAIGQHGVTDAGHSATQIREAGRTAAEG